MNNSHMWHVGPVRESNDHSRTVIAHAQRSSCSRSDVGLPHRPPPPTPYYYPPGATTWNVHHSNESSGQVDQSPSSNQGFFTTSASSSPAADRHSQVSGSDPADQTNDAVNKAIMLQYMHQMCTNVFPQTELFTPPEEYPVRHDPQAEIPGVAHLLRPIVHHHQRSHTADFARPFSTPIYGNNMKNTGNSVGKRPRGGRRPKEEEDDVNLALSPVEKRKRNDRRERNRLAAARCRQRRMELIAQLEEKVAELEKINSAKQRQVEELRTQKEQLEVILKQHDCKLPAPLRAQFEHQLTAVTSAPSSTVVVTDHNSFVTPMSLPRTAHVTSSRGMGATLSSGLRPLKAQQQPMMCEPTLTQVVVTEADHLMDGKDIKPDINELSRPNTLPFTTASTSFASSAPSNSVIAGGNTSGVNVSTPSSGFDQLFGNSTGLTPVSHMGLTPIFHTGTTPLETPMESKSLANL